MIFQSLVIALGDPAADTDTYTKKLNHQVGSGDEICELWDRGRPGGGF